MTEMLSLSKMKQYQLPWLCIALMFCGCQKKPASTERLNASATIVQRSDVTDKITQKITKDLENSGVTVLSVGQDYRVIIPADKLFIGSSSKIDWHAYKIMNRVVDYLKQFRTVDVRVNAYSTGENSQQAGAISYARVRNVINYLWEQAIDTRLIYTDAHVSLSSQQNCHVVKSMAKRNANIEISFRNTIV